MNEDLGWVDLGVRPDAGGFGPTLSRQIGPDLDRVGGQAGSRFSAGFKKAAVAGAVGLATAGAFAVKLGADSISAASDLEESTNKVSEVFGKAADRIFRFSEKASDALGQTNEQARSAASTFGIFGKAADLNDREAAKFSKRMVTLASDLASFNNTEPDEAVQALGAALRGESEPIRAYGVLLDEATLKAEALALGILKPVKNQSQIQAYQVAVTEGQAKYNAAVKESGKESLEAIKAEASLGTARDRLTKATEGTIPPLTQQQKLLAAQSQIFKQTEVAQGDFARTSDGLANQQRRLSARFEDTKAKLGKGLLPIMNDAAGFLLDEGIPAFEDFADWFTEDGIPAIKEFADEAVQVGEKVKPLIDLFADLPAGGKIATLGTAIAGGLVVKHQVSKIFDRGGIANPMFVVVTNPGGLGTTKTPPVIPGALPGAAPKAFGTLPKFAKFLAIAGLDSAPGQDSLMKSMFGVGLGGDGPKVASDAQTKALLAGIGAKDAEEDITSLTGKVNGLNDALFLTGDKKIRPVMDDREIVLANRRLGEFISKMVDAGKPVTPYIDTSSIERALALIARLPDAAHGVPTAGTDGGVPFLSGGGQRAGVLIDQRGSTIVAHDYDDFVQKSDRKARQAGLGGRPQ